MIQSMEILQLPLMALQERIEQEMQENETLEVVEQEAGAGRRRSPAGKSRRPHSRRTGTGRR